MSSTPSRWKQVPFAASVLVVCGLLICGAIYLVNYRERDAYIASRNFRLLAVLAQQTESAIDAHFHTRIATRGTTASPLPGALEVGLGRPAIVMRFKKGPADTKPVAEILKPVFAPKLEQGAYDTLALAMPDGRIAFAVGKRQWELGSMNLAMLRPEQPVPAEGAAAAAGTAGATPFSRIAVLDAVIAGVPYQMFIQPCCQLVAQGTAAGAVVVGLVAADAIRAEAMAISPTLLVIASLLVALAFLAWPFLSIAMPGPRKRISKLDALQLGFSGTVGLSIATILAVTSVQCAQLESDVERQLNDLATELDQELVAEITSSAKTLDALEAWMGSCPSGTRLVRGSRGLPREVSGGVSPWISGRAKLHCDQLPASAGSPFRLPELRCRGPDRQRRPTGQEGVAQAGEAAARGRQRSPVLQRGIHLLAGPADAECSCRGDDLVHRAAVRASVAGVVHHRPAERGAGQAVTPGRVAARRGDHAADAVGHQSGDPPRVRVRHHRQDRPGGVPLRCPAQHLRGPVPRNRPQPPAAIARGDRRGRLGPHRVPGSARTSRT